MAVTIGEVKTRFTADTSKAENTLKGFVEKQAKVVEGGFGGLGRAAGAAFGLAATAALAQKGVQFAIESSKLAQQNAIVENSFVSLAAEAGASADSMMAAMRTASANTVSDYDLMLSANRAMMLGVADSAEEMQKLLEVARSRGQAMGLSTTQAFNDIVTGLGRGSALILDNLGIIVDLESAYANYAAQLGKTAEELTKTEQKQALINDAMQQATRTNVKPMKDAFAEMNTSLDNMKVAMGELFSPVVTKAADILAQAMREGKEFVEAVQETAAGPTLAEKMTQNTADMEAEIGRITAASREELEEAYRLLEQVNGLVQATGMDEMVALSQVTFAGNEAASALAASIINYNRMMAESADLAVQHAENVAKAMEEKVAREDKALMAMIEATKAAAKAETDAWLASIKESAAAQDEFAREFAASAAKDAMFELYDSIGDVAFDAFPKLEREAGKTFTYWMAREDDVDIATMKTKEHLEELVAILGGELVGAVASGMGIANDALIALGENAAAVLGIVKKGALEILGLTPGALPGAKGGNGRTGGQRDSGRGLRDGSSAGWRDYWMPDGASLHTGGVGEGMSTFDRGLSRLGGGLDDVASSASDAADGLGGFAGSLESMLGQVQGLFDPSAVTQDQLDAAARGEPQNFADDYLRRLRDEIQNGKDWEGVSAEDAARMLGIDPNTAAEEILNKFEAAWKDSSLFANPENLGILNMDAIQAELDRQLASAEGEKNLKALFGIGDDEDVNSVAALGLGIQSDLSGWLTEHGMDDAGARLAEALGGGVQTASAALGGGVSGGFNDWLGSDEGHQQLDAFAEGVSDYLSKRVKIKPTTELPDDGTGGGGEGLPPLPESGDWGGGATHQPFTPPAGNARPDHGGALSPQAAVVINQTYTVPNRTTAQYAANATVREVLRRRR